MEPDTSLILKMFFNTMLGKYVLNNKLLMSKAYVSCLIRQCSILNHLEETRLRKKPAIGKDGRCLNNPDDRWKFNAWYAMFIITAITEALHDFFQG